MTDHDKPMSMVERVARAICIAQDEDPDATHDLHPNWLGWHQYAGAARAAISAMREPSVEMLVTTLPNVSEPSDDAKRLAAEAFSIMSPDREDRVYQAITAGSELVRDYQSMIDAALESK